MAPFFVLKPALPAVPECESVPQVTTGCPESLVLLHSILMLIGTLFLFFLIRNSPYENCLQERLSGNLSKKNKM